MSGTKLTLKFLVVNLANHAIGGPTAEDLLIERLLRADKPFEPAAVYLPDFVRLGADNCVWDIKTVPTQVFVTPAFVTQGSNDPIGAEQQP